MQQPESLDSADLDAILELERSPGYALVVKRITTEIERKRTDLENGGNAIRLCGEIAALRVVLSIPGSLKHEARAQLTA